MHKLLITFKAFSKPIDINKIESQFIYDSNMSGFSDLDDGIKFNFVVISLVSLFPSQRAQHILVLFDHFHGNMTSSSDLPSDIFPSISKFTKCNCLMLFTTYRPKKWVFIDFDPFIITYASYSTLAFGLNLQGQHKYNFTFHS